MFIFGERGYTRYSKFFETTLSSTRGFGHIKVHPDNTLNVKTQWIPALRRNDKKNLNIDVE
jgi:hypothetical protein